MGITDWPSVRIMMAVSYSVCVLDLELRIQFNESVVGAGSYYQSHRANNLRKNIIKTINYYTWFMGQLGCLY